MMTRIAQTCFVPVLCAALGCGSSPPAPPAPPAKAVDTARTAEAAKAEPRPKEEKTADPALEKTAGAEKKGGDQAKPRVDDVQNAMKKGPWRQAILFKSEEWKDGLHRIRPHVETFLSLVEEFAARYTAAKEEEGGLDFSDLERLTLQALCDGDLKDLAPSAVAKMYHRQFKHVLVDEYQDINEVQDAILTLLSHECVAGRNKAIVPNLFCVGDVKQSIYRFRLAELRQFQKRRDAYSEQGSHGIVVDL